MSKFYITTSIVYANAAPHIGFAQESIQADVLARYHRQRGEDVFFLTGTDEHGAKINRAAEKAGEEPQKFVDRIAEKVKALKPVLNLSWDDFIRTTDQEKHWPNVRRIWKKLAANGDLYKKNYRGLYCVGHEAFVTEKDLLNGVCRDHQTQPEMINEENWFFRLTKYAASVRKAIADGELLILPTHRQKEVLNFIDSGLEDVSFSRPRKDLSWGVPVPDDDSQTIYVWADALTNYLYPAEWWPADVHIIGKDILRFHAVIWPAMLLAVNLPLPKKILVHGHIMVDGQKMSKTVGNVIDPFELVERYGVDAARYYLLREIPSDEDGDFSFQKFEERYQGDLANGLGNFAARVLALAEKLGVFEKPVGVEIEVNEQVEKTRRTAEQKIREFKLHEALTAIWNLISFGDEYVNKNQIWAITDENEKKEKIFNLIVILDNVAALLKPFLPASAEKIEKSIHWFNTNHLQVKKMPILFPRLK